MAVNNKTFKGLRKRETLDCLEILSQNSINYTKLDFKDSLPETHWGYQIEGLIIPVDIDTLRHMRPEGFTNVEIVVDCEIESEIKEWENLNDPFTSLNFRSHIKGTNAKTKKTHYLSFHIDRHDGKSTRELHPLYHLQYLQNAKMKAKDEFDHGDSLQLDVPRMLHLPMEFILGVTFLLSNFAPNLFERITQERQWISICREYQLRVWRPYFNSLENFWAVRQPQWTWNPKLNCPYLV